MCIYIYLFIYIYIYIYIYTCSSAQSDKITDDDDLSIDKKLPETDCRATCAYNKRIFSEKQCLTIFQDDVVSCDGTNAAPSSSFSSVVPIVNGDETEIADVISSSLIYCKNSRQRVNVAYTPNGEHIFK